MEFITGLKQQEEAELEDLLKAEEGTTIILEGAVHSIRDMGEIAFVILRKREGLIQTVWEEGKTDMELSEIREGDYIHVTGQIKDEERAPHGKEVRLSTIRHLSHVSCPLPLPIDKWKLNTSLEAKLDRRSLSLRNIRERARFRIQEGIVRGFRDFLYEQGFTEIHTPKIGAKSAEGGANMFRLSYFHRPAVLQQSPQLYKQMMVGVFDRVFETGPVFRAEKHNTRRHLNEYTSLDFEMGYIHSFLDICAMETGFLQYTMNLLEKEYSKELKLLNITLPDVEKIPHVRFDEAKRLVSEKYNADFVFVTHYPSKKRPFYAMDDPEDTRYTLSFDLLYHGLEITTGGQRIHDLSMLEEKIQEKGMTEEGLEQYLDAFRFGMPPHGGLGIGLERLTMQLLGEDNVREACLFPRDMSRLEP